MSGPIVNTKKPIIHGEMKKYGVAFLINFLRFIIFTCLDPSLFVKDASYPGHYAPDSLLKLSFPAYCCTALFNTSGTLCKTLGLNISSKDKDRFSDFSDQSLIIKLAGV